MNKNPNRDENREEKNMTNASRGSDVSDHPFRGMVINEFGKPLTKACVSLIGATVATVRTEYVDRRLFIRGMEAIYCYDLRANNQ